MHSFQGNLTLKIYFFKSTILLLSQIIISKPSSANIYEEKCLEKYLCPLNPSNNGRTNHVTKGTIFLLSSTKKLFYIRTIQFLF